MNNRKRNRFALLAMFCLLAPINPTACQRVNAEPTKPGAPRVKDASVVLTLKVAASTDKLTLDYQIANNSAEPVYVYNLLNGRDAGGDNERIYRYLNGDRLQLFLGTPDIPFGRRVHVSFTAGLTKIEPYRTFEAQIPVELPVKEYTAYFSPSNATYLPKPAKTIELFIEYLQGKGIATEAHDELFGALQPVDRSLQRKAKLLRSGALARSLEVLEAQPDQLLRFQRRAFPDDTH